jgi:hypothetical protein
MLRTSPLCLRFRSNTNDCVPIAVFVSVHHAYTSGATTASTWRHKVDYVNTRVTQEIWQRQLTEGTIMRAQV